jgi:hypothetical protein
MGVTRINQFGSEDITVTEAIMPQRRVASGPSFSR